MEKPPEYTEDPLTPPLPRSTLSQHLTEARTVRINNAITSHILPHFQTAVASGLSRATLILFPVADRAEEYLHNPKSNNPAPEVIGFPSTENIYVIRLEGKENTLDFWRQPAVIRELEGMLESRLQVNGYQVWALPGDPALAQTSSRSSRKKIGSFFRRKQPTTSLKLAAQSPTLGNLEAPWAAPCIEPPAPGEIRVEAQLKDISTKHVTDMGLYDSQTNKGVVVKMEIGD
ncbi:MAG: hypothetical protein LQ340_000959 [Diploschistes diacapsis]|nr:MAG: hypothetical protein LQ340_000959 [Diploschistes diacapsis]